MTSDAFDTPARLVVQEVAPRDGLQIEPTWVPTDDKVALVDALSLCGFSRSRTAAANGASS